MIAFLEHVLVTGPFIAFLVQITPNFEGDYCHEITRIEEAREQAIWWLIRLERGFA